MRKQIEKAFPLLTLFPLSNLSLAKFFVSFLTLPVFSDYSNMVFPPSVQKKNSIARVTTTTLIFETLYGISDSIVLVRV
ncbi:MAG: hypothetical protein WDA18_06980 [Candidatus Ratteibacteria bacterium]|jgi:hypothetical protein